MLESGVASLAQKPHLDTRTESCQDCRKLAGCASISSMAVRRMGAMEDGAPDVSTTSSPSSFVQVGTLPKILDQWRIITSTGLCLIWVKSRPMSY